MSTKVPRSALDAARFTSTIPHAASKSKASSPARIPNARFPRSPMKHVKSQAPPGETPQEKVKRLRAALDKAKAEKETPLERMILRGRVWADRAHRITVAVLILISIAAAVVTVYALIQASTYNRKKRHEYYLERLAVYTAGLMISRQAVANGTANQAQIDLVAYDDEETARLAKIQEHKATRTTRWTTAVKDFIFGGLKPEQDEEALDKLLEKVVPESGAAAAAAVEAGDESRTKQFAPLEHESVAFGDGAISPDHSHPSSSASVAGLTDAGASPTKPAGSSWKSWFGM